MFGKYVFSFDTDIKIIKILYLGLRYLIIMFIIIIMYSYIFIQELGTLRIPRIKI